MARPSSTARSSFAALSALFALTACFGPPDYTGRPCDEGECPSGFICDDAEVCRRPEAVTARPCSSPEAEGLPCDDQNACTYGDVCVQGSCVGMATTCAPTDACDDARCDPETGACTHAPQMDGFACDDGDTCTTGDSCSKGRCTPGQAAENGSLCTGPDLPAPALCLAGRCTPPVTCRDVRFPEAAPSGVYAIQPSSSLPPFAARCDLETDAGGWTLVGRELSTPPGPEGQKRRNGVLRFLGVDTDNADALAAGTEGGVIGARLQGDYEEVSIRWGSDWLTFRRPPAVEIFGDQVNLEANVEDFSTSDARLSSWVEAAGGAIVCIAASVREGKRPGDSSWAVKPRNDKNTSCGCNSGAWQGRGAFYGGTVEPENTACSGFGGGFAGTRDNGEAKGAILPPYETQIWVR